jgi:hypothetical protein
MQDASEGERVPEGNLRDRASNKISQSLAFKQSEREELWCDVYPLP